MSSAQDKRREVHPPRIARWLLHVFLARQNREYILGDLDEEFQEQVRSPFGLAGAQRWYWQQVWQCLVAPAPPASLAIERDNRKGKIMEIVGQEVRYAARMLRKSPAFTTVAVLTLALGIGANTAIFSVVDAVLLRPLPFRDAEQLVVLWETNRADGYAVWRVAPANFVDWRAQAEAFSDAAAFGGYAATLTGNGDPIQVRGGSVTPTYFATLGAQPVLGRSFQPEDEAAATPVVVLGHGFWQSRFGGSESVLGQSITLDGRSFTVIGVMPNGAYPAWPVNGPRIHIQQEYQDLWRIFPKEFLTYRGAHVLGVVGRLKPGVTLQQAQQQMDVIATRLEKAYPENNADEGVLVRPLMEQVTGSVRPALLLLLAAVGALLLVACSNVAGLLLARLTARRHEIAVRCALGAGHGALLRQFLVEGMVLAGLGAMAGGWLAYLGHGILMQLAPQDVPRLANAGLDGRVLAFTAGVSLLAAVFFALAPAWSARRVNVSNTLKETSRGSESGRTLHLRDLLVVTQVSLAVVLTVAAALLLQSFSRMSRMDAGFRTENLLVAEVGLSSTHYVKWEQVVSFYRQMLDKVRNAPGVTAAHFAYDHPLDSNWLTGFSIEGRPGDKTDSVQLRIVTPGYFAAMGQRVLQGREFEEPEDPSRPGVAVINRAFERRYFPDGHALGKIILSDSTYGWRGQLPTRFEIVGIVDDIRRPGLDQGVDPSLYVSAWQAPVREMALLVRTANDPAASASMVRRAALAVDPELPVAKITTMESLVAQGVAQPRLNTVLMSIFSGLGLLLALVGIYGLVAFWVGTRVREIGVRVALGASRGNILALVLRRGALLVLPGIAAGLGGAWLVSRFLRTQLYSISALDPATYVIVSAAILGVGLLACLVPARAATRVDPIVALRYE